MNDSTTRTLRCASATQMPQINLDSTDWNKFHGWGRFHRLLVCSV